VKAKRLQFCATSTGTFCWCCKTAKQAEVNKQLGLGMSLYFQQLKSLTWLFFLFTVIQLPAMVFFFKAGNPEEQTVENWSTAFEWFTLGNLGQWDNTCDFFLPAQGNDITLFCPYGYVESLEMFALASPEENRCPNPEIDGYNTDPF
jgi:hypothetical protein